MTQSISQLSQKFHAWATAPAKPWRMPAVVFMLLLLTGFLGAAQTGLFDRDEPRYAQATREMLNSGNWVVPTFNGEARLHKPILIYWLMSASFAVFGDSAIAARFPSIVASALAGVILFIWSSRWFGRRASYMTFIVWATVPLTLVESRMATTDAVLNLLTLSMMASLASLFVHPRPWVARLFWLLLGLSILTKGPVGLLMVAAGLLGTRFLSGVSFPRRHLRIWEGCLILCLTVVPWLVAVTLQTNGSFLQFAVGRELLGRVVSPAEEHRGIPGYYVLLLVPMFFPWICFLPMSLKSAWAKRSTDPRFGFLIGWAIGPLAVLELMATKLVHYHYPSYAALAMITGLQLSQLENCNLRPNLLAGGKFLKSSLIIMFALVTICFYSIAWVGTWQVALPGVLAATLLGYYLFRIFPQVAQGRWSQVIRQTGLAWVLTCILILGWMLPVAESGRLTNRVAEILNMRKQQLQSPVVLGEFREPSLIFRLDSEKPVPLSRSISQIRSIITNQGAVIMPMTESEWKKTKEVQELEFQPLDRITGLDWDRGKRREIVFCLITLKPEFRIAQIPGENPLPRKQLTSPPVLK